MGQTIVVEYDLYEKLTAMKRAMGPQASYATVVRELLRNSAGSCVQERIFLGVVRGHFQRIEIQKFINLLLDQDLLGVKVTQDEVMALVMLVINGSWEKMNTLVAMKAEFIERALDTYQRNLEVNECLSPSLRKKTNGGHLEDMNVQGVIPAIGTVQQLAEPIDNMPVTKSRSKPVSSKRTRKKSIKA